MDDNPADFKDDLQNPVEIVSWLEIQKFLNKLNQRISHLNAQLPSEAQWEYACRAGTTTPFSFGENISSEQVNYDANYPYAKGKKGHYREKTIAVKALPANGWGLYQMHGNVWEWCQDEWNEDLGTERVLDPVNTYDKSVDDGGVDRVLRGGSWFYDGGSCRSAFRYHHSAGYRYRSNGFRISLGHELQPSTENSNENRNSLQTEPAPARRGAVQE
jgi:formylglycine-generating enzyme required for sulfatase activity